MTISSVCYNILLSVGNNWLCIYDIHTIYIVEQQVLTIIINVIMSKRSGYNIQTNVL